MEFNPPSSDCGEVTIGDSKFLELEVTNRGAASVSGTLIATQIQWRFGALREFFLWLPEDLEVRPAETDAF